MFPVVMLRNPQFAAVSFRGRGVLSVISLFSSTIVELSPQFNVMVNFMRRCGSTRESLYFGHRAPQPTDRRHLAGNGLPHRKIDGE